MHVKSVNCILLMFVHTLMSLANIVLVGINVYVHDMS